MSKSIKNLKYYQNLKYEIRVKYDLCDNIWYATFPDLRGCMAHGKDVVEAVKKAAIVKDEWLKIAFGCECMIKEPKNYEVF